MTRTRRTTVAALAVLVSLFLALPLLLVVPTAQALTSSWAGWSPVTGTSNDYALRLQPASPGFPAATVASDSRGNVQLAGGTSTFLGAGTPPGVKYGSSVGSPYLVLRPRADTPTSPSTTTYTFDDPTPDTGWAFVLGDIDSDQVQVRALDDTGAPVPAARIDTWFRGAFNYTASGTDVPSWSATTSTLTGNATATDTDGASGWFEPDLRLSSLTLVFTRRAGFPVYQTWFVTRARPLTGTVTDVSGAGDSCPPQSTTLTLVSPYGEELTTTRPSPSGAWSFGEWATQDGYTVRLAAPATCAVVGPAERPLNNRGADGSAASQGAFQVREVVPQAISGRVVDGRGDPVAGVSVTLTRPDTTTVTRTTDPDGRYLFDENPVGVGYTLAVTVPTGYVPGPGGTTRGPVDVAAVPIAIADVVVAALPAVSGRVTGGGDGLGGVPVTLTPAGGGPALTTTTLGDGTYTFTAVPAGPVTIAVTPPPGYTAPPPLTPTVGTTDLGGQDIGLTRPGGLSGTVLDGAGTGVAGVAVTVSGPGAPTTVQTDAAGAWFLDGVPAGTWTATPTPPPGSVVTAPAALTATITTAGELRGGLDFTLAAAPSPTASPTATPTPTPTATPTSSPTTTATAEPSSTPSASQGPTTTATGPNTGGLPDTGGPPLLLAVLAGALVLSGVGLIARARRRG